MQKSTIGLLICMLCISSLHASFDKKYREKQKPEHEIVRSALMSTPLPTVLFPTIIAYAYYITPKIGCRIKILYPIKSVLSLSQNLIGIASYDDVYVCDIDKKPALTTRLGHYIGGARCLAQSPDHKDLAIACADHKVYVVDIETGKDKRIFSAHNDGVNAVAWSCDGAQLASGGYDTAVRIWNFNQKMPICTLQGHKAHIRSVCFKSDATRVLSAGYDGAIRIWDVNGQKITDQYNNFFSILSALWSRDDQRVIAGGLSTRIIIWTPEMPGKSSVDLNGHRGKIEALALSPNGQYIASASSDSTIRLWDEERMKHTYTLRASPGFVPSVAFSRNSKQLIGASTDQEIHIWNLLPK